MVFCHLSFNPSIVYLIFSLLGVGIIIQRIIVIGNHVDERNVNLSGWILFIQAANVSIDVYSRCVVFFYILQIISVFWKNM